MRLGGLLNSGTWEEGRRKWRREVEGGRGEVGGNAGVKWRLSEERRLCHLVRYCWTGKNSFGCGCTIACCESCFLGPAYAGCFVFLNAPISPSV